MSSLFNFSFQPCMYVDSYWDRDWKILHFKFLSADSDLKQKERIKDTSENKYAIDKNAIKVRIHGLSYLPVLSTGRGLRFHFVAQRRSGEPGQGIELLPEN